MKKRSLIVGTIPLLLLAACSGNQTGGPTLEQSSYSASLPAQESSAYASSSLAGVPLTHSAKPAPQEPSPYHAGAIQPYSASSYRQALADGKIVVIDFHANWCPICKANAPRIQAAFDSTHDANVVGFIADYDTETALEDQFGVSSQSTLVKVKGSSQQKVGTLGPGPLTTGQVAAFLQS